MKSVAVAWKKIWKFLINIYLSSDYSDCKAVVGLYSNEPGYKQQWKWKLKNFLVYNSCSSIDDSYNEELYLSRLKIFTDVDAVDVS